MEPIHAQEVREVQFDETVDVVVVGLGVAGACAAVSARQAGADVLVVERSSEPGGTSAHSGGLIYLGGGTALQIACGYQDSVDNMAAFLRSALGPGADGDRVDAYCEGSSEHFDWLVSIGVPFRAAFCDEPNRESADDSGLVFSGGEDTYPFDEVSVPVPRGHKPQCIDSAGGFLMERLGAAVSAAGARVVTDAQAQALIVEGDAVVGVQMLTEDGARFVRVRGGIILATGGFIHNEAMVAEHCPLAHLPDAVWRIGTPNDDGRGASASGVGARCRDDLTRCIRVRVLHLWRRHTASGPGESSSTAKARDSSTRTPTPVASALSTHALRDQDGFVYMITDDLIHEQNLLGLRVSAAAATPEELAG